MSTVDPRIETLMFCSSVNGKKNLVWSLFALVCGSCMAWTSIKTLLFCVTLENKKLTYQILLIKHLSILERYNYFFQNLDDYIFPIMGYGVQKFKNYGSFKNSGKLLWSPRLAMSPHFTPNLHLLKYQFCFFNSSSHCLLFNK